jgi:hypothetical protein
MRFTVSFEGRRRFVDLVFGRPMDVRALMRWRTSVIDQSDPHVRDALEFRKLATKRWRYYLKGHEAATSLRQLKQRIRDNPTAEIGFLLMAKAHWHAPAPVVGCCFCRRTWSHHLIVDFLAVHPKVLRSTRGRLRGVWQRHYLFTCRARRRTGCLDDLGRSNKKLGHILPESIELTESHRPLLRPW